MKCVSIFKKKCFKKTPTTLWALSRCVNTRVKGPFTNTTALMWTFSRVAVRPRSTCSSPRADNWLNKVCFFGRCSYKSRHGRAMDLMCSPRLLHLRISIASAVLLWGCMKGKKEAEKGGAVERRLGLLCCSPNANGWREDGELSRHGVWKRDVSSVEVLTRLAPMSESRVSCSVRFFSSESSAFSCWVPSGARRFGRGVNRCPLRNFARLFLNHTWRKAYQKRLHWHF